MNMRIVLSSLVTFALLMFAWTYVTDKGYEKVKPKIEQQKKFIFERQEQVSKLMQEDTPELGTDEDIYKQVMKMVAPEEYEPKASQNPIRPNGTYLGVLKGANTKIAMAKFTNNRYWIMINDNIEGDITEKGKYDFQITDIYFQPNGERDYFAEYEQLSPTSFRIFVGAGQYLFEKTDNVKLDF